MMKLVVPQRFTRGWWLIIGATTITVGILVFFLLPFISTLNVGQTLLLWFSLVAAGDLIMALSMEAVAPTRVVIGPGETQFNADKPRELATVVFEFDDAGFGKVQIRGETWNAKLVSTDGANVRLGNSVMVVDRDGLTLLVSAVTSDS